MGAVTDGNSRQAARDPSRRPYYYGSNKISRTVHAYTEEEWGLGASSGGGDHKTIRSFWFSLVLTVVVALPATLMAAFLAVAALFRSPLMALIPLFFGLLFGLAVLQGYFNLAEEWRGRKARQRTGLPKPWFTVPDDHAYEWFLKYPSPDVPLTLEYFPESRLLRAQAEATDPPGNNNKQG